MGELLPFTSAGICLRRGLTSRFQWFIVSVAAFCTLGYKKGESDMKKALVALLLWMCLLASSHALAELEVQYDNNQKYIPYGEPFLFTCSGDFDRLNLYSVLDELYFDVNSPAVLTFTAEKVGENQYSVVLAPGEYSGIIMIAYQGEAEVDRTVLHPVISVVRTRSDITLNDVPNELLTYEWYMPSLSGGYWTSGWMHFGDGSANRLAGTDPSNCSFYNKPGTYFVWANGCLNGEWYGTPKMEMKVTAPYGEAPTGFSFSVPETVRDDEDLVITVQGDNIEHSQFEIIYEGEDGQPYHPAEWGDYFTEPTGNQIIIPPKYETNATLKVYIHPVPGKGTTGYYGEPSHFTVQVIPTKLKIDFPEDASMQYGEPLLFTCAGNFDRLLLRATSGSLLNEDTQWVSEYTPVQIAGNQYSVVLEPGEYEKMEVIAYKGDTETGRESVRIDCLVIRTSSDVLLTGTPDTLLTWELFDPGLNGGYWDWGYVYYGDGGRCSLEGMDPVHSHEYTAPGTYTVWAIGRKDGEWYATEQKEVTVTAPCGEAPTSFTYSVPETVRADEELVITIHGDHIEHSQFVVELKAGPLYFVNADWFDDLYVEATGNQIIIPPKYGKYNPLELRISSVPGKGTTGWFGDEYCFTVQVIDPPQPTVAPTPAPTAVPTPVPLHGDVTADGKVDIMDVIRLLKKVSGWEVTVNEAAADVTGDGKTDIMDVIRLLKHVSGWDVELN